MDDERPTQSLVFVVLSYVGLKIPFSSSIVLLDKNADNLQYAAPHLTRTRESLMHIRKAPHLTRTRGGVTRIIKVCPKMKRSSSLSSLDTHQNQKEYGAHDLTEMKMWYSRWCSTYCFDLQKDYVAHIAFPLGSVGVSRLMFCTPTISAEDFCGAYLCAVPNSNRLDPIDGQLKGCLFNLRTNNFKSFQPPESCRYYDHVVAVGQHIYFLARYAFNRVGSFLRYDPVNDSWETLEPFPLGRTFLATAVLDDTLVLHDSYIFWAYDFGTNKWYEVCVDDTQPYIRGVAVVLNNTIYALSKVSCDLVLALSIEKKKTNDGDLEFHCSVLSKIVVRGMKENEIVYEKSEVRPGFESRHLVHLGEDNFCIVQSWNNFTTLVDYQSIQVTYIELKKGEMNVTGTFIYKLKLVQKVQFNVEACFSLPDSKAAALKEGGCIFPFNPYPEDYASEQKDENR